MFRQMSAISLASPNPSRLAFTGPRLFSVVKTLTVITFLSRLEMQCPVVLYPLCANGREKSNLMLEMHHIHLHASSHCSGTSTHALGDSLVSTLAAFGVLQTGLESTRWCLPSRNHDRTHLLPTSPPRKSLPFFGAHPLSPLLSRWRSCYALCPRDKDYHRTILFLHPVLSRASCVPRLPLPLSCCAF
jgi:hypothetical protein